MERAAGIEPACLTWKDSALPLSYARAFESNKSRFPPFKQDFFTTRLKIFELHDDNHNKPIINNL